jgi:hypothetical protein
MRPTQSLLVLAACSPLLGCGTRGPVGFVTHDSAGVTIAENLGPDRPLGWTFERRFAVGGADEGPESFAVVRGGVAPAADGGLYVFDMLSSRLIAFDSTGGVRWGRGRTGGGPGEFSAYQVWGIAVTPAGAVEALDLGNMRRTWYAANGDLIGSEALTHPPYRSRIVHSDTGVVVSVPWRGAQRLVFVVGSDTTLLAEELGAAAGGMVVFEECGQARRLPPLFESEDLRWHGNRDVVVVSAGPRYEIDLYRGARLERRVRRAVAPREPSAEAMRAWYPDGFVVRRDGTTCRLSAEEVAVHVGWAPLVPAIRDLAVGPTGEIWVARDPDRDGRSALDVISAEGRYLGTLPTGTPVPIAFTAGGDVIALERNDVDVQRLVVYRVVREGGGA